MPEQTLIQRRRNRRTGTMVEVWRSEGPMYHVVCADHRQSIVRTNVVAARFETAGPDFWCLACKAKRGGEARCLTPTATTP